MRFGGIEFDNYELAHGIGTIALAIILFDGGLRTSLRSFRAVFGPAVTLATAGVAITASVTGAAASWLLGIPLLQGMLLGSIVGSTDAAAVFAVLRGRGVNLRKRLAATLEVESGANDPMAIFLTVTRSSPPPPACWRTPPRPIWVAAASSPSTSPA